MRCARSLTSTARQGRRGDGRCGCELACQTCHMMATCSIHPCGNMCDRFTTHPTDHGDPNLNRNASCTGLKFILNGGLRGFSTPHPSSQLEARPFTPTIAVSRKDAMLAICQLRQLLTT
jgi:hypothetical protein